MMNSAEKEAVLHCLKSMIDEEVCEECPLYGTTGTDHCEKDCVRLAINALEQEPKTGHWRHYEGMLICSECGSEFYDDIMEYCGDDVPKCCPDCGAKMKEVIE